MLIYLTQEYNSAYFISMLYLSIISVSYTHLDVYKRQDISTSEVVIIIMSVLAFAAAANTLAATPG